jgi:ABC-type sugar transport system substrate-binding protein
VLDGIKAGTIHWTLGQNPWAQGFVAAALAAMELDPGYPARDYDTGAEIVDSSNIDAVIAREARFA